MDFNLKPSLRTKEKTSMLIVQSNSMVEAVNKHVKHYYLFRHDLKDLADTISYLSTSIQDYNHKPHGKLHGYTPYEVLSRSIPKKVAFHQDIIQARKNRVLQNQQILCCEDN
jgi:hypothetical protein